MYVFFSMYACVYAFVRVLVVGVVDYVACVAFACERVVVCARRSENVCMYFFVRVLAVYLCACACACACAYAYAYAYTCASV